MEMFKELANQHSTRPKDELMGLRRGKGNAVTGGPPARYGDDTRVLSTEDGVERPIGLAKNMNFSLFLRPRVVKGSGGRCGLEELGRGNGFVRKAVDLTKETGTTARQTCGPDEKVDSKFRTDEVKNISRDAEPSANPGLDKQLLGSSSTLASTMEEKRMQVPALSACSQGASNDPKVTPKRSYEDCQSSSQSYSDSEDSKRMERSSRGKERRSSVHNSERQRRGRRVNKKLRALQELLPNCDEVDQVAVLDEAIEYLKTLQQQFLVLSTGSPMYMSPLTMLPTAIQHMYTPYPNQFPVVNVPRGLNIGAGVGCGGLQFPISRDPRTTASIGSGMQMLGLQSMARIPPFIPSFGRSSAPPSSTQGPSTDTVDLLDYGARSGSSDIA